MKSTQDGFATLCGGDAELIEALKASSHVRKFKSRDRLISQGDNDDSVYVLLSGRASVVIYSRGGHELWLGGLQPGALFGEMAVLLGLTRTASVLASSAGTFAVMSGAAFEALLLSHPKFARIVIDIQSNRVQLTSKRMFESNALSVPGRVYAELLRVGRQDPNDEEIFVINPALSVSEFSKRVNATRESVSRAINDYEKSGLVTREGKRWVILAPNFT